jgi:A/G-specific adenine glycosylase
MCFAYEKELVSALPVKSKTTKVRNRYFNYIVLKNKGTTSIKKRKEKDIWTNLYDFPLIETDKELTNDAFLESKEWKKFIGKNKYIVKSVSETYKHILSHQKIYAKFWEISCTTSLEKIIPSSAIIIKQKDIHKYAVPRLIENYLAVKFKN